MKNKITRISPSYTQVSNRIINDKSLSLKAKGLYAFMYSKPDSWNFTIRSMASQLKEGVDGISSTLKELRVSGWVDYRKATNGSGEYFIGYIDEENPSATPNTAIPNKPNTEKPNKGKSVRISNKDLNSNKDNIYIGGFSPNETTLKVINEKYPNITDKQLTTLVDTFKDKAKNRQKPLKDLDSGMRYYVREGWVKVPTGKVTSFNAIKKQVNANQRQHLSMQELKQLGG